MVVIGSGPAGESSGTGGLLRQAGCGREALSAPDGVVVRTAKSPSKTPRATALYITGFRRRDVYALGLTVDPETTVAQLRTRTAHGTRP